MADDVEKIALIYVQWSDDGQHIRKWDTKPFDGGEPMYSRSFLLSEERVEAAAEGMAGEVHLVFKAFDDRTRNKYLRQSRAALTAAIGEPSEFSGWVEIVDDDRAIGEGK